MERVGGTGEDPRIPFGKGWDLARRPPHDAYGRPRPGAAYLKGFALCRRPPYVCGLAFWLARVIVLTPKPAICELWWAHFGMQEHHLGDVVVPRDTQQHTLRSSNCTFTC